MDAVSDGMNFPLPLAAKGLGLPFGNLFVCFRIKVKGVWQTELGARLSWGEGAQKYHPSLKLDSRAGSVLQGEFF